MVEIIIAAENVAPGATVTGHAVHTEYPHFIVPCKPTPLTRVYRGYGSMRAETGTPPRRGFGKLIGSADITDTQINQGLKLWLRVVD